MVLICSFQRKNSQRNKKVSKNFREARIIKPSNSKKALITNNKTERKRRIKNSKRTLHQVQELTTTKILTRRNNLDQRNKSLKIFFIARWRDSKTNSNSMKSLWLMNKNSLKTKTKIRTIRTYLSCPTLLDLISKNIVSFLLQATTILVKLLSTT
jgi:hypothetical protein